MNKLNLCEILKGHEGKMFYSPILGDLKLRNISDNGLILTFDSESNPKTNTFLIGYDGKLIHGADEIAVYPSKDQRDWNAWNTWDKDNNNETIPKTWDELKNAYKIQSKCVNIGIISEKVGNSPIEKSALALLKIHQLIEIGYGGNVTNEEWNDRNIFIYTITPYNNNDFCINETEIFDDFVHIAFHTKEQAKEFLSYPKNIQLLKDYFMITD